MTRLSPIRSALRLSPRLVPILLASSALLSSACTDLDRSQEAPAAEAAPGHASAALTSGGSQRFSGTEWNEWATCAENIYGRGLAVGRFNGDSIDDIAIETGAESIEVRMGTGSGVSSTATTYSQDSAGFPDTKEDLDVFGQAIAAGDFNGDGLDDIAIGVPCETYSGYYGAGVVNVVYSSTGGSVPGPQLFSRSSTGVPGSLQEGEHCGYALATGRFNDDGYDDLAIGCPGWNGSKGAVIVIYGSSSGLNAAAAPDPQEWNQDTAGIEGVAEADDEFGSALAAGDFDGDTYDDLAIGVPREDVSGSTYPNSGAVNIIYGTASGLSATGDQIWSGDGDGLNLTPASYQYFGSSLAAGSFNTDAEQDLVIGVPDRTVDGNAEAGAVVVMYGTASGLSSSGDQLISQNSNKVADTAYWYNDCGFSVAVGDVNDDGYGDIIFGCPGEYITSTDISKGGFNVIYGPLFTSIYSPTGEFWSQASFGVPGDPEDFGGFGASMVAGDFDGDGKADVAVSDIQDFGNVTILRGN